MRNRIAALLLSVVLLLTYLPGGILHASAASDFTASEQCVAMLKEMEGFSEKPYWDYGQWTVGYGTKCPDDKVDEYKANGISKEEAESLLSGFLQSFGEKINKFNDTHSIGLNQAQFDALLLFTYNCGTNWMRNTSGEFCSAVINHATGNDFIYPITLWCSAGDEILSGLIRRRLSEANMYLNGVYDINPPENYAYVRYNANGGSVQYRVQGYDTNQPVALKMTASLKDYTFAGWYSARTGGNQITTADSNTKNMTLYARWLDADGNVVEMPIVSTPITPVTVTVMNDSVNLREGPGTDYASIGKTNKGDTYTITATAEGSGYIWGQFETGWIALTFTNYNALTGGTTEPETPAPETPEQNTPPAEEESVIATGMVHTDELKVRGGPGFSYGETGSVRRGQTLEFTRLQEVEDKTWGKTKAGWVSMEYILLDDISDPPLYTGYVLVSDGELNLRQGPGFAYEIVSNLKNGDEVQIIQVANADDHTWGRTSAGWFSMMYFTEDKAETEKPKTTSGTVNTNELNMRAGAGTDQNALGYLNKGSRVEILEQQKANGLNWGKITAWTSLAYVDLDAAAEEGGSRMGTVNTEELNIRTGAGLRFDQIGKLKKNAKIEILEQMEADNMTWGKFSAWICMDYVTLDSGTGFTDVSADAYYADAVAWAVEQGITTGKTATSFQPSQPCTRAQVATFLWRANGKPAVNAQNPFTDVPSGKYYTDAVLWAVANQITTGKTETTFQPDSGCTSAQVVTFLWRAAGEPAPQNTHNPFTDVSGDAYYYQAVLWAVEQGITTGKTATTFLPGDTCTRAQIVTFLYRALK